MHRVDNPLMAEGRRQRVYDHRLRELVRETGDVGARTGYLVRPWVWLRVMIALVTCCFHMIDAYKARQLNEFQQLPSPD